MKEGSKNDQARHYATPTRTCHCSNIEQQLRDLGLVYERCYVEEHPKLLERYNIRHCPVLIINEARVIPVDGLTEGQLRDLLGLGKLRSVDQP